MQLNKELISRQFSRNIDTYNQYGLVQKQICSDLISILKNHQLSAFNKVFEIGCGTGFLTDTLLANFQVNEYVANDLIEKSNQKLAPIFEKNNMKNWKFLLGDAELIDFPKHNSLIVSSSTIQWFSDFEAFIEKSYNALCPGGILTFSTFGPLNYIELKKTLDISLNYLSLSNICNIVEHKFKLIFAEETVRKSQFDSPIDVLKHIKKIGANGIENQKWTKGQLIRFEQQYNDLFGIHDGKVNLSYHPIFVVVQKK